MLGEENLFIDGVYKYKGIELMPTVMDELLMAFYAGKQFKRREALQRTIDFHRENGGILGHANYVQTIKKALGKDLKAENKGYGIWYLKSDSSDTGLASEEKSDESQAVMESVPVARYFSDKTIGNGVQAVYLYYYDTYRKCAELQKKDSWECKIGRTDVDPVQRVIGQAGTCYPELPHIALVINCDNSGILETTLHNILKMRGKWLENAPGTEWFLTSPSEIETIYQTIVGIGENEYI